MRFTDEGLDDEHLEREWRETPGARLVEHDFEQERRRREQERDALLILPLALITPIARRTQIARIGPHAPPLLDPSRATRKDCAH